MTRRALSLAAAAALAAGCLPHGVDRAPRPPAAVPETFGEWAMQKPLPERWWLDLDDPDLHGLVDAALTGSLTLQASWQRVAQARAIVRANAAGYWPQLEANLTASRQRQSFDVGEQTLVFTSNSFSASLQAAYEIDLWRRVGAGTAAAAHDLAATRNDYAASAMSLVAGVAEAWYDVVFARAQRRLLEDQTRTNELFLELVELRFRQGLASAVDVYQQRQQVTATRAQLPLVLAQGGVAEHRLAVLVGKPPRALPFAGRDAFPDLPAAPEIGVPADLLARRPDLRAAQARVVSADYRVGAAIANRLPSLRVSGSLGYRSPTLEDLFDTTIWSLVGNLLAPIFDGGRRAAEVDRSRAQLAELVLGYGQTFLTAVAEVESALVGERQQLQHIVDLEATLEAARHTLREARARYREGLSDFLPVLTALQAEQRAELQLLAARRQLLGQRIQLYRALGGTWVKEP